MTSLNEKLVALALASFLAFTPAANAFTPFEVAQQEVGVTEDANPTRVIEYLNSVDPTITSPEVAWCSAFMNYVVKAAGWDAASERLNARSWMEQGERVLEPAPGDVVILWRGNPNHWTGHVGFFVEETETHVRLLSGNSGDRVGYAWYPKSRVLDYRRLEE